MKDRLLRILQEESMTSNKFAELMEVRPSNISHLLAGRNHPNFEFTGRMLLRFPNLNPDWLINGSGDMYRAERMDLFGFERDKSKLKQQIESNTDSAYAEVFNSSHSQANVNEVISPNTSEVFAIPSVFTNVNNSNLEQKTIVTSVAENTNSVIEQTDENHIKDENLFLNNENEQQQPQFKPNPDLQTEEVIVEKVIVFYNDKTFDIYNAK